MQHTNSHCPSRDYQNYFIRVVRLNQSGGIQSMGSAECHYKLISPGKALHWLTALMRNSLVSWKLLDQ